MRRNLLEISSDISKPLSLADQRDFLNIFANHPAWLMRKNPGFQIFIKNFFYICECSCVPVFDRTSDALDVRKIFARIILRQARFLQAIGIPIRIAILGSGHLFQVLSLVATLSLYGIRNFSIDLIDELYSKSSAQKCLNNTLKQFLQLMTYVLGFHCSKGRLISRRGSHNFNDNIENFNQQKRYTGISGNIKINFFGQLDKYRKDIKTSDHVQPTIIAEIDFLEPMIDVKSEYAVSQLRAVMNNGIFHTRANKHKFSVSLTAESKHNGKYQMDIEQNFDFSNHRPSD